jgi:hypothetical protein
MAEIINLKRARKAKARSERDAQAAENRRRFGRPKAERELEEARQSLDERQLDAHRLRDDEGE